jgi:hypothetical protein
VRKTLRLPVPILKLRISEIHAISVKRLSKIEAADHPSNGAELLSSSVKRTAIRSFPNN